MALFSWSEVQQYTGFSSSDFKDTSLFMTATQWTAFGTIVCNSVEQTMKRWCNVGSFEARSVTEYHNGRGQTGDGLETGLYLESDRIFNLREYSTSVASVYEDVHWSSSFPSWTLRTPQDDDTFGDYVWWNDMDIIRVRFHQNVPSHGIRNVKIVYTAGYPSGSAELDELKTIGLRIAQNYLVTKKKVGEAQTIRAMGTRDYSQMFAPDDEKKIITDDIALSLCKYRRWDFGGGHIR